MPNKFLKKNSCFYIYAPANYATGGPELCHQLAYKLKTKGLNVKMLYYGDHEDSPVHPNYARYQIPYVTKLDKNIESVAIVPEIFADDIHLIRSKYKIIWWQSVDNYFLASKKTWHRVINKFLLIYLKNQNFLFFNKKVKKADWHFSQSRYSYDFLMSKGIRNISMLSDYIDKKILEFNFSDTKKQDIVTYYSKQNINTISKIKSFCKSIKFIEIKGMTRGEVIDLLSKSKVYIDFGNHPGKDRLPREAAILGNIVITGSLGSASNEIDISIPKKYKFNDKKLELTKVYKTIQYALLSHKDTYSDFSNYVRKIKKEEETFDTEIEKIFLNCL